MSLWPNDVVVKKLIVSGEVNAGKSTLAATIDPLPANSGTHSRTVYFDLEGSAISLSRTYNLHHIDIAALAAEKHGDGATPLDIFDIFYEQLQVVVDLIKSTEDFNPTVCVIDTMTSLDPFAWVERELALDQNRKPEDKRFPDIKPHDLRKGKFATTMMHKKATQMLEKIVNVLEGYFETVVMIYHLGDEYSNDKRTGRRVIKGKDMSKIADLHIQVRQLKDGSREAYVLKQRLVHTFFVEGQVFQSNMLPSILRPQEVKIKGQTAYELFPDVLRRYMKAPQFDYGELGSLPTGFDEIEMTERERFEYEAEISANHAAAENPKNKNSLIEQLVTEGHFGSAEEVTTYARENGIRYRVQDHDAIYQQLVESANG